MLSTELFAFGLKPASSVPFAATRAMLLRGDPPTLVKLPPSRIWPSACTAML